MQVGINQVQLLARVSVITSGQRTLALPENDESIWQDSYLHLRGNTNCRMAISEPTLSVLGSTARQKV